MNTESRSANSEKDLIDIHTLIPYLQIMRLKFLDHAGMY